VQRAWIIAIGTELTLGQTVDTNSAWLAQRLAALGLRSTRHICVGDEHDEICRVLREALAAADVVLVSGGLGPTADDLTRAALAEVAGVDLEEDAARLEQIRRFFVARGRDMQPANRVQALLPRGSRALENPCGTAPGIRIALGGVPLYALPGVPFEMRAMFERHVEPELRDSAGGAVLLSRRLNCFGVGEAEIGARLQDLMVRGRNPEVGTTASLGIIGVRINARSATAVEAAALLDSAERAVRTRLGTLVFGREEETLAGTVGHLLRERGATLALAESCTGGLVGKWITDVPGSSAWFRGALVTYADSAKSSLAAVPPALLASHGAVSAEVAAALAAGARSRFDANYSLGVTGIAGPAGGTPEKPVGTVYIALAGPGVVEGRCLRLGADSSRAAIRERAAAGALNLLRLTLLEPPQPAQLTAAQTGGPAVT
jgi:nicotinamide-nucleotide amidase